MNSKSSIAPIAMTMRLEGKVAIITGGASGFGEATTRLFIKHGAKVLIADVQDEKGFSLCKEIASSTENGDNVVSYIHCDVTDETDVIKAVDLAIFKYGKLDIMFNNAGILGEWKRSILDTTNGNFKKVFDVNVYGGFLGAKHAARVMIPRKSGVILFTASLASVFTGTPHAYTMSKHAIVGLMKNLCVEMGQSGVRVNAISPGFVATPLACNGLGLDKETTNAILSEVSVLKGMVSEADDIAQAALYLASDEAKYVHGLNLILDGGYGLHNPSFSYAMEKLMT